MTLRRHALVLLRKSAELGCEINLTSKAEISTGVAVVHKNNGFENGLIKPDKRGLLYLNMVKFNKKITYFAFH